MRSKSLNLAMVSVVVAFFATTSSASAKEGIEAPSSSFSSSSSIRRKRNLPSHYNKDYLLSSQLLAALDEQAKRQKQFEEEQKQPQQKDQDQDTNADLNDEIKNTTSIRKSRSDAFGIVDNEIFSVCCDHYKAIRFGSVQLVSMFTQCDEQAVWLFCPNYDHTHIQKYKKFVKGHVIVQTCCDKYEMISSPKTNKDIPILGLRTCRRLNFWQFCDFSQKDKHFDPEVLENYQKELERRELEALYDGKKQQTTITTTTNTTFSLPSAVLMTESTSTKSSSIKTTTKKEPELEIYGSAKSWSVGDEEDLRMKEQLRKQDEEEEKRKKELNNDDDDDEKILVGRCRPIQVGETTSAWDCDMNVMDTRATRRRRPRKGGNSRRSNRESSKNSTTVLSNIRGASKKQMVFGNCDLQGRKGSASSWNCIMTLTKRYA